MNKNNIEEVIMMPCADGYSAQLLPQSPIRLTDERRVKNSRRLFIAFIFAALTFTFSFHTHAAALDAESITAATNAARVNAGITTVTSNTVLTQAANAKASSMFAEQYFNHVSPTGVQPWSFMTAAGYSFTSAGENLAIDFVDSADVVQAWLHSPEHRKNLLDGKFTDIGVAVQSGTLNGVTTTVVVQFFGATTAPTTTLVSPKPSAPLPTANVTKPLQQHAVTTAAPVAAAQPAPVVEIQQDPTTGPTTEVATMVEEPLRTPQVEGVSTKVIPNLSHHDFVQVTYDPKISFLIALVLTFYTAFFLVLIAVQKKTASGAQLQPAEVHT